MANSVSLFALYIMQKVRKLSLDNPAYIFTKFSYSPKQLYQHPRWIFYRCFLFTFYNWLTNILHFLQSKSELDGICQYLCEITIKFVKLLLDETRAYIHGSLFMKQTETKNTQGTVPFKLNLYIITLLRKNDMIFSAKKRDDLLLSVNYQLSKVYLC